MMAAMPLVARAADEPPDLILRGTLTGKDNHAYRNVPFQVPAGVDRITIQFDYDRSEHTTIDLGLLGPGGFRGQGGFRGWSGGSKSVFTVSDTDATPSYLPGAIRPGRWTLVLGIPNIRAAVKAAYTARVWFGHPGDPPWEPAVLNPPLRAGPAWYRGDLHMHDAHSDGGCANQSDSRRVPCPLFLTAAAAARRGLDFIGISDHNTLSQLDGMRELQPYFDRLLLMPGRELTSNQGHANLYGTTEPVDFRIGSAAVPDWNAMLRRIRALHGFVSINHPVRPSGEACMGCGWTADPPADLSLVQGIEAVNGMDAQTAFSGIPFWQARLDRGYRLTGVGGSDNHDARQPFATTGGGNVGTPTTVVWARELSQPAILEGLRAGHVFVDVEGSRDRLLEFTASAGGRRARMGDALAAGKGAEVELDVHVMAMAGGHVEILADGKPLTPAAGLAVDGADRHLHAAWTSDGGPHWLRADAYDAGGKLLLVGNPVYVNPRRGN
jgi:hypothetical protein